MADPDRHGASAGVLHLWERGAGLARHRRALVLVDEGPRALGLPPQNAPPADEPLGRHHARLLRLRAQAFGNDLDSTAPCPQCGDAVEFTLDAAAIAAGAAVRDPTLLELDGYSVAWRSPGAEDVVAAADAADVEEELVRRCVLSARDPGGAAVDPAHLPAPVRAALAGAMEAADPLAEVLVDVVCPGCAAAFQCDVDVPAFVWAEVEARAKRLLLDVDVLARAYGWTESEVLALSDARRAAYLRIVEVGTP